MPRFIALSASADFSYALASVYCALAIIALFLIVMCLFHAFEPPTTPLA